MRDQARRMSRLIDDLLSLPRIVQTEHVRPQDRVDFVGVVRHVVDTLRPMADEARAEVVVEAPERALVIGDRDELIRLAENLIENAIKYGGGDDRAPRVEIAIAREDNQVVLSVRDNGPGVAPEHIPRLTERFFRTDAGASRAKGGTGLGLAIVKHILARHRGRLAIDSRQGEGARFRAFIPAAP
jgi:two-component system phosphate regulon sensor histidine kinase PhoR